MKNLQEFTEFNRCWWDGEKCLYCSEIKGLQEAGKWCMGCWRIDKEQLLIVVQKILEGFKEEFERPPYNQLKQTLNELIDYFEWFIRSLHKKEKER